MAAPVILIEVTPRRASDGVGVVQRLAGGGAALPYYYGGEHWRAGIAGLPTFITSLDFDGTDIGTGGVPGAAEVRWAPAGNAPLGEMAAYYWPDAAISVRIGPEGAMPPVVLSGRVLGASISDGALVISLADPAATLKQPLPAARYAGTGWLEGPVEWEGQLRRRIWGRVWNLRADPIDAANNIYCLSDPLRPIGAIDAVRDKGAPAAALTMLGWQGSASDTFAELQAAVAPQGGGVVAPSIACIKWWTRPAGDLTADARGETAGGYAETAADIAARLVAGVNGASWAAGALAAANAARPAAVGWVVREDTKTVSAMLDELLGSVSLLWVLDSAGQIAIREWAWGASVAAARSVSVARKEGYKPVASRQLGYRRNELQMARGDLAGIVLATDVAYLDGTPAEALKPSELGATAGAIVPTAGAATSGNLKDESGRLWLPGELLNSAMSMTPTGQLQFTPAPGVAAVAVGQVTLPGLGAASTAAQDQVERALDTLSGAVVRLTADASTVRATMRDAGIYTDPASGQVRLYGVDQAADRLNTVDVRLSAAEAKIVLRATTTYVDNAIAMAVIDPSQVPVFASLEARIAAAEIDIDGLSGAIDLKASNIALNAATARVTTAETRLDAVEGVVSTKVSNTSFNALDTRVQFAETSISAFGDAASVKDAVRAVRQVAVAADDAAAQTLASLLAQDASNRGAITAITEARRELTAKINDDGAAEAAARLALAARMAAANAALLNEATVRAAEDSALASSITGLQASIGEEARLREAAVLQASIAQVNGDTAVASSVTAVSAAFGADARDLRDATDDAAENSLRSLLAADASRRDAAVATADARRELTAKINDDVAAVAAERFALAVRVAGAEAELLAESQSRAAGDSAMAQQISGLAASVATDTGLLQARIDQVDQARADADAAMATQISMVSAIAGSKNRVSVTSNPPQNPSLSDLWIDTAHANIQKFWNGTGWIDVPDQRIEANAAAIASEADARADAVGAVAQTVATHTTILDGHQASITQFAGSINGLKARVGVRLDVNGRISGWVLNDNGASADFDVVADKFRLWGTGMTASVAPFEFDGVTGTVRIKSAIIGEATIGTTKISDGAVSQVDQVYSAVSAAGDGSWQTLAEATVEMAHDGNIVGWGTIGQTFGSGVRSFDTRLVIDDVVVFSVGGDAVQVSIALNGSKPVLAGARNVKLQWSAVDSTVSVPAGSASLTIFRRYK